MKQKFYLDTAIWRDYYENRSDRFRPLGEWASQLLNNVIIEEDIVLYSDFVIEELKIKYSEEEIENIFSILEKRDALLKVNISEKQLKEAGELCRVREVAFGDTLHAILARDNNAVMVTRDKHFEGLVDIAEIKKPEELL